MTWFTSRSLRILSFLIDNLNVLYALYVCVYKTCFSNVHGFDNDQKFILIPTFSLCIRLKEKNPFENFFKLVNSYSLWI